MPFSCFKQIDKLLRMFLWEEQFQLWLSDSVRGFNFPDIQVYYWANILTWQFREQQWSNQKTYEPK